MSKLLVFSVRDVQVESFMPPMFFRARGEALRSFSDVVQNADEQNLIHKHPQDYKLFEVGEFDQDTGKMVQGDDLPRQLATGLDFVEPEVRAKISRKGR